ncbi:MAG: penicillin-binding transpeptidase domain-containing protein, partial [Oscillospiraceae bacterium]
SMPDFYPNEVSQSLNGSVGSFLNRCLTTYSVGSSFKLVIAMSALEQGFGEYTTFPCLGKVNIGGRDFSCHYKLGHGATDMKRAIAWSCNPYFINLAQNIDIQKARALAEEIGFGTESYLCDGIIAPKGYLQAPNELLGAAEIANFSFGQGSLMATPLQVTQMISVVANGGKKTTPRLVLGTTADGQTVDYEENYSVPQQIVAEKTADKIKEFMINTIEKGSGENAKPQIYTAGGKTASAQTGQYKDGEEIVHAWFAGFYPGEKPKYAITVLCEEGVIGGEFAAPVFAQICDGLLAMGKIC